MKRKCWIKCANVYTYYAMMRLLSVKVITEVTIAIVFSFRIYLTHSSIRSFNF